MKKALTLLTSLCLVFIGNYMIANNINISNAELTGQNSTNDYVMVKFDLSWENSWCTNATPVNRDAAWVFVKYRILPSSGGDGIWRHALLSETGHVTGSGTTVALEPGLLSPSESFHASTNPALGLFIYRSAEGNGTVSITGAQLRWNYGANGVPDDANLEINVYAVEMVYVPAGSYAIGSGGSETSAFTLTTINTAESTFLPEGTGKMGGMAGGFPTGQTAPSSMLWPNGYQAYYSMKYETSQQQYVDFLNSLTYTQQQSRIGIAPSSAAGSYAFINANRSGIRILSPGVATSTPAVFETTLPNVACGFLKYPDGAAYADWAGLRPMTELEYEKTARGILNPLANEYPWGNTSLSANAYTLSNSGMASEGIGTNFNTTDGNALFSLTSVTISGPGRVGIFSANPSTTGRITSGSTFFGAQELGGNLTEQVVNINDAAGRSFTGVHGNGALTTLGNADVSNWPGMVSGEVTGNEGIGRRGGNFSKAATYLRTSDRGDATSALTDRTATEGFRAVRSVAFSCGVTELSVNHVSGAVAPVNKVVAYGTVTGISGEPSKCWITKNLGATQQATAVSDNTEASAGWYWQFNRKQGYKHDGSPTPTWIVTTINESSDWLTANDPCRIELGSSWRIPTYTEWSNVSGSSGGNWSNWNGPWGSGLKLHAAGYLYSDGTIGYRGTYGTYSGSTQYSSTNGYYLFFSSGNSYVNQRSKEYASSIRCLRTWSPEATTTDASSITTETAVSGGLIISDGTHEITARGVCWDVASGPTITLATTTIDGSGSGSFTSNLTGLTPTTTYYLRAYATTSSGTIYGNEITFTTATPFNCTTNSLTVNHTTTGGVAPVDKSVTYGTVTGIPGEAAKCWITRNLGASQQATAVTDATEPSAGWFWQFNRKQGYKHDGTNRTPNSTWITSISENSDWQIANDPCSIELGGLWRIPTFSEWENVIGSSGGNWSNYNDAWNSGLKLHAPGYLWYGDGGRNSMGSAGYYWSSTAAFADEGRHILITNSNCDYYSGPKAQGFPIRCLRSWAPEVTTTAISSITQVSAVSGGSFSYEGTKEITARGVCWSTSTGPTIALTTKTSDGTGSTPFTSSLTGLTEGTTYFVRAYATNTDGTVYGNEISFTTNAPPYTCGTEITVSHTAGTVAPVSKSVTYGTATNIPGESSKCWITRNLGASQQPTAVTDATEASAGWYWRFNRKQGYKYDGSCTPTWPSTSISEDFDWTPAEDPCKLELGSYWRVPTLTEWQNLISGGSWTLPSHAYNSALKLHHGGYLYGDLHWIGRGENAYYWSSTRYSSISTYAKIFIMASSSVGIQEFQKNTGMSIRCLREYLPVVTTTNASSITTSSAVTGGNVTSQGSWAVTEYGVCWSTSQNPTIAGSHLAAGQGTGTFSSTISGLSSGLTYYVRAYATNQAGTAYGNQVTFSTLGCFIAGTKIAMADGTLKRIEEVEPGDSVLSFDKENEKTIAATVLTRYTNPPGHQMARITFSNGIVITCTTNHPFWVEGKGWCSIDPSQTKFHNDFSNLPLIAGDQCTFVGNGNFANVGVKSIELLPGLSEPTYNFTVAGTSCYFANGILVHNKP